MTMETVNPFKEPQEQETVLQRQIKELLSSPEPIKFAGMMMTDDTTETESGGSSEETESPKSVGSWRKMQHNQVLRIREEDYHIGEEDKVDKSFCGYYRVGNGYRQKHRVKLVLLSKPVLPRSPLSGKTTTVKSLQ